ncbi:MAG: cell wall-binding repeat-containing protein [Desulfitobacteriaceae bacterium]
MRKRKTLTFILLLSFLIAGFPNIIQAQEEVLTRQQVDEAINSLVDWEKAFFQEAFAQEIPDETADPLVYNWLTIGLGRLECYDGLATYLTEDEKYINQEWNSASRKVTNLTSISLAVGAAKGNPRNFGGKDLIAEIANYSDIEAQGINGPVFALIALDSGNYDLPLTAIWTRENLLRIILDKQLPDGGFSLDEAGSADPDITAMAVQALAPYYSYSHPEVQVAVNKVLTCLETMQEPDGGFKSWGTNNCESVSQIIIALCSLGIDIDTDPHFLKNDNSLLSALFRFKSADGGFKHILTGNSDSTASEQALLALVSYVRLKDNKNSLYDFLPEKSSMADRTSMVKRLAGTDCYTTAVEIAKSSFADGADTVILARGDVSTDALPAVPLAQKYHAPLLLTSPQMLPEEVFQEIKDLGTKTVLIMGGEGAVGKQVADKLSNSGITVQRVSGTDRYETAYQIAKLLNSQGQAILVNSNCAVSFPDALSISAWAGYNGVPILYADATGRLSEATALAIAELKVQRTLLIGGMVVLPSVLESLVPGPERYSGQDRYETNTQVLSKLQPKPGKIYLATGEGFADALTGAAVAAQFNAWIILTGKGGLTGQQQQLLQSVSSGVSEFQALGGAAVVPDSILKDIEQLLKVGKED